VSRTRPLPPPPARSDHLYASLPADKVNVFRFLLEAEDHLALFTILDKYGATLRLSFAPGQRPEVLAFLDRAKDLLPLTVVAL
jgi:hypothetical protein